jgi:pimeloyl-ACP methyl ester carboxylesterase
MLALTDQSVNQWRSVMASTVRTPTGELAYTDAGEGPAVVLLHATLHDRRDFDAIVPALRRDYRVIALDWPGHGDSPAPVGPPTAAAFADALVEFMTALDIPAAALIGNSVGGFAAARLAITHPDRVSALVLVNTGGFLRSPLTDLYCRTLGVPAVMRRILPRFVRSYMKARSDNDYAILERTLARAKTRAGADLEAVLWRSFATRDFDLRPHADRIKAPTLIVWGSKDTAIPIRFGRKTREAITGAQFEPLPTGHVPFSSDPEGFLAITTPFLAAALAAGTPQ